MKVSPSLPGPVLFPMPFRASSPLREGFSHLGVGWCASIAGCMIRLGRLVILASSRERYDIYFSTPRPWGWKMHVSSLAKAVWVIIYASVSSPMPRPYWSGVWRVMHDPLYSPFPAPPPPRPAPVHIASFASPTGHCQSVPPLISTCQVQTLTRIELTVLSSSVPPSAVPKVFFHLTFDFYGYL